jgi:hypothetical protein
MLIKIEAINIDAFVNSSQNLSVIRGGGLKLLNAPEGFRAWLEEQFGKSNVTTITKGASKAVFRLQTSRNWESIETDARAWLLGFSPHATIALATLPDDQQGFFTADEALTTDIRRRQMRSFSFAGLPEREGTEVCAWDRVRPAHDRVHAKGETFRVSSQAAALHEYGRDEKARFLNEAAELPGKWEYTLHMDELSGCKQAGVLHHKVAIFYADGNSFTGRLRQALGRSKPAEQEKLIGGFDAYYVGKRREFLQQLLNAPASRWQTTDGKRRIELLLWGGDELMLVVPSWCGWETAEVFCRVMKDAVFTQGNVKVPLKHAMGLIFAHHKAPIHALTKLAHDLADEAKLDRDHNLISYLALESFDHVGEDLDRFREMRCPDPTVRKALVLGAEDGALGRLRETLHQLKAKEFPRRKVYQAALGLSRDRPWTEISKDLIPFLDPWKDLLAEWRTLTGKNDEAAWYHLAELWDYLGEEL